MKPQSAYIATAILSSLVSAAAIAGRIDGTDGVVTSLSSSSVEVTSHQSSTPPTYRVERTSKRADQESMPRGESELLTLLIMKNMVVGGNTFDWKEYLSEDMDGLEYTYRSALDFVGDEKHSALFDSRLETSRQMLDDLKVAAEGMKRLSTDPSPGAAELSRAYELSAIRWQFLRLEPEVSLLPYIIGQAKLLYDECYEVFNLFLALEDRSKLDEFVPLIQRTFAAIREIRTEVTHLETANNADGRPRWAS